MSVKLDRREFLRLATAAGATASTGAFALWPAGRAQAAPSLGTGVPFSTALLRERARELSTRPWRSRTATLPPALEALNYDQFRDIRYVREQDLWYGEHDVNVEFFHMGYFYKEPVRVHSVEGGTASEVRYSPTLFDFGKNDIGDDLDGVPGFAGLRLLYPLNTDEYKDELGAFLGASYFRLLGKGMLYGLSARGLAINTVDAGGEEFPIFTDFWFEVPTEPDRLVMHALLDSPSVAGAYRFDIRPGDDTVMDIELALYPREEMATAGIAPLTSMFLFAPNDRRGVDDFREGVHDSDGLLMHTGAGEWIWRPVRNPDATSVSTFTDPNVRGFGLMQREREFSDYQDLESRYERRPSAWVEPVGDWGPGRVTLLELNTPNETNDNLVVFWRPDAPLAQGTETVLRYKLHWCLDVPADGPQPLRALATRTGSGASIGVDAEADSELGTRLFMVDFGGDPLPEAGAAVEAVVTAGGGTVSTVTTEYNEPLRAWRTYFRVRPAPAATGETGDAVAAAGPVEIRCYLKLDDATLSETWLYRWDA